MLRRVSVLLACIITALGVNVLGASSASAAGTCAGKVSKYMTAHIDAFLGHRVQADAKFCYPQAAGTYGPYWGVSGVTTPTITFPSRVIAGAGEVVELVQAPYIVYQTSSRYTFRFSVKEGVAVSPVRQTFNFDVHYYNNGTVRICFTGGSCGPYSS